MKRVDIKNIVLRYLVLIFIGIFSTQIFHFIFFQLTFYPVYFLFQIFFNVSLSSNTLWVNAIPIEIVSACVAGSAYFLLLILNLSTPEIKLKKRIMMILFSFFTFLIINILRIFFLSFLLISKNSLFDITHKVFWYIGSTILVAGIWFLSVKIFGVKEIPFYSDIKNLYHSGKYFHKSKSSKKH